jgi:hypothetical protein
MNPSLALVANTPSQKCEILRNLKCRKVRRAFVEEQNALRQKAVATTSPNYEHELSMLNLKRAHTKRTTLSRTTGSRKKQER